MPRVSQFYGIVVAMHYDDHAPPHCHVAYSGQKASIAIRTGEILDGRLPTRAVRLFDEWLALHADELMENWDRAQRHVPLLPVAPLS